MRVEEDERSGKIYLVFEVVDEKFKQRIKKDWSTDIPVELIGKELKEV